MADITAYNKTETVPSTGAAVPKKYHDNGDGTFSEVTWSGGGTAATGAATSAKQDTGNTSLASVDTKLSGTGAVKDNGAAWTTSLGVSGARFTSADQSAAVASVSDAPTSGQKIVVSDIIVSADAAMQVDFSEETSGTIVLSVYLAAASTAQVTPRGKLKLATANKKLQVRTSAAGNISVTPLYYSEA